MSRLTSPPRYSRASTSVGKPLTLFEIMVAKTYDERRDFDLAQKFHELVSNLTPLNYETLSDGDRSATRLTVAPPGL